MKSRGIRTCGCPCGSSIPTGTNVVRYAGRIWRVDHLIAYQKARHTSGERVGAATS